MKLHEAQTSDPAACQDRFWELIPWYVNRSLPDADAEALERHAETCPKCTAEITRQRALAKEVVTADPFEDPLARSWDSLRVQIQAETQARTPQKKGYGRFLGSKGGLLAVFGTVAAACLVLMIQVGPPTQEGFQTLTSGSETSVPVIKFQAIPTATKAELAALLAEQGATLLSGPSDQGIYTAGLPEGTDLKAVSNLLMATSSILFAAPETE